MSALPYLKYWLFCLGLLCVLPSQADDKLIRLAVVNTPYKSGLMTFLLKDFEKTTGLRVALYGGEDLFDRARAGQADLLIAHYGKSPMQNFVLEGYGSWPQMVFANQQVIIGPSDDPAGIRNLTNASQAMKQIATQQQPFLLNHIDGVEQLSELIWFQAGQPDKQGWWQDRQLAKGRAMKAADKMGAYTLWGAIPFLQFQQKHQPNLTILISQDPVLQRVMAITLVNPDKVAGINRKGAEKLRDYLLKAQTQATISQYRQAAYPQQLWWPAARNN